MQIGVSDGGDVTKDEDGKENDQELGSVDITTTTIEKMQTKETGIQLLKLMWGEFLDALGQSNLSRIS